MKTIEEKARAYDKVRKKIAIRFGSHVADEFFAEFEESEDEKIRKGIIELVKQSSEILNKKNQERMLSWLERQGEHANFRNKIQVGDKVTRNEDGILVNLSQLKRVAKPADKIEPKFKVGDKIYLKPEYRMPDDDTPIANTVKEIRRVDDKHYRFDGAYIFIEDQDKYELVEQKPEENKGNIGGISPKWSVEDEENFCSVYLDVKSARQNTVNSLSGELKEQEQKRMDEVISWLRTLKGRVLPKQEWNEEDEQHIDSLLKRLDALCRNKFERTRFAISEDRDWLKSLRPQPQWRPSEDDIIILEKLIKGELEPKVFQATLQGILEQLKKLKEG